MATAGEIYERHRQLFRPVPAFEQFRVCPVCRGPVLDFLRCFACNKLTAAAPFELAGSVVPMTVAPSPGPWYNTLVRYKGFGRTHVPILTALTYQFLFHHGEAIEDLLGGEMDFLTIVPSTRGKMVTDQALWDVLQRMEALKSVARSIVHHVPGAAVPRQGYAPEAFSCRERLDGSRVVLLEDTWVSGSKAVSVAGALREAGAASVVILPIARKVEPGGYYGSDHPYWQWIQEPYDVGVWPLRGSV